MEKTKIIVCAILCLLIGGLGGYVLFEYLNKEPETNNPDTNTPQDRDDSSNDSDNSEPEFDTNKKYDNMDAAFSESNVKDVKYISKITESNNTNENITYIFSKTYDNMKSDKITIDGKTVYFNMSSMSFEPVEEVTFQGDAPTVNIAILKVGKYYVFYETDDGTVYKGTKIYDENMNEVASGVYSIYEPVMVNDSIYFEVLESPMECKPESTVYKFDFTTGKQSKAFSIKRTQELVC